MEDFHAVVGLWLLRLLLTEGPSLNIRVDVLFNFTQNSWTLLLSLNVDRAMADSTSAIRQIATFGGTDISIKGEQHSVHLSCTLITCASRGYEKPPQGRSLVIFRILGKITCWQWAEERFGEF